MAYPFDHLRERLQTTTADKSAPPAEWRCSDCGKLLGVRLGTRLHIRLQRHTYLVSLPVEAVCRGCGTVNQT